jgi:hypothetical protein
MSPVLLVCRRNIEKIDERHYEHPNQVHEVPVQSKNLDVIRVVTAAPVPQPNHDQSDDPAGDMEQV